MSPTNKSFLGTWHNEQGSTVHIELGPEGRVAGVFHTGVGFGTEETFAITGFTAGRLIVFSANFGKYGSLTSWVGHLVEEPYGAVLQTLWQMTVEVPHPKDGADVWKTVWSGANTFRPGPPPERRRDDHRHRGPPLPLWMS